MTIEYEGASVLEPDDGIEPYDMHCPHIGGSPKIFNYWKARCLERQRNKTHYETCYPFCKAGRPDPRTLTVEQRREQNEIMARQLGKVIEQEPNLSMATLAKRIGTSFYRAQDLKRLLDSGFDPELADKMAQPKPPGGRKKKKEEA